MVVAFRVVLTLLPLLSGAIVVKELPNSTDAKALIQEHAAIAANNSGFPGLPVVGTSVQAALMQVIEPVKEKMIFIRVWINEQLKALGKGLSELKDKPGDALDLYATKFAAIFQAVEEKLEPVRNKLSLASPAIEGLKHVLKATGSSGAADKIADVLNSMSENVISYQKILSNCTEVAEGLKDVSRAGPGIAELKKYLDTGASTLKSFGDSLENKVSRALEELAKKLGVDASTFSPTLQAADDGWRNLEESSSALAGGLVTSSQSLPPQVNTSAPEENSGAAAAGALGALAAAVAALVQ